MLQTVYDSGLAFLSCLLILDYFNSLPSDPKNWSFTTQKHLHPLHCNSGQMLHEYDAHVNDI